MKRMHCAHSSAYLHPAYLRRKALITHTLEREFRSRRTTCSSNSTSPSASMASDRCNTRQMIARLSELRMQRQEKRMHNAERSSRMCNELCVTARCAWLCFR